MSTINGSLVADDSVTRSKLSQVADAILRILPYQWRIWNSGAVLGTAAADDLGIVLGTFGTNVVNVQAGDVKTLSTTRYALVQVALPDYYDPAQSVTIRLRAGMETTVSDTSCTIDVECYEVGDDGTAGSDLCTTATVTINSLTEADKDFTITTTNLVAGDILEIRVSIIVVDSATGTAVTPVIYKAAVLFDAKG